MAPALTAPRAARRRPAAAAAAAAAALRRSAASALALGGAVLVGLVELVALNRRRRSYPPRV